jgi:hypothetical protein
LNHKLNVPAPMYTPIDPEGPAFASPAISLRSLCICLQMIGNQIQDLCALLCTTPALAPALQRLVFWGKQF